jgi:hypothetical protein
MNDGHDAEVLVVEEINQRQFSLGREDLKVHY